MTAAQIPVVVMIDTANYFCLQWLAKQNGCATIREWLEQLTDHLAGTPDVIDEVVYLATAGYTDREIANKMGVTNALVSARRRRHNIPANRPQKKKANHG
jgi:FixJ family two-component response regulator